MKTELEVDESPYQKDFNNTISHRGNIQILNAPNKIEA